MIDFTIEDLMELARQAELQKRVEADGLKTLDQMLSELPEGTRSGINARAEELIRQEQIALPEDLRGKLGEGDDSQADGAASQKP